MKARRPPITYAKCSRTAICESPGSLAARRWAASWSTSTPGPLRRLLSSADCCDEAPGRVESSRAGTADCRALRREILLGVRRRSHQDRAARGRSSSQMEKAAPRDLPLVVRAEPEQE